MSHNFIEGVNRVKPVLFAALPRLSRRGYRGEVVLQAVLPSLPCGRRHAEDKPIGVGELIGVLLAMSV